MLYIAREIADRRCPKCKAHGTLQLQLAHASVVCGACMRSFIDPFEEGPWDDMIGTQVVDTVDGNPVYSYQYSTLPTVTDNTIDENIAEFYKYLVKENKIERG